MVASAEKEKNLAGREKRKKMSVKGVPSLLAKAEEEDPDMKSVGCFCLLFAERLDP